MTINKASLRYGYARVSTRDQTTDTQVEQLERLGIDRAYIATEKRSGKKDRPVLNDLVNELQNGDELHVTKLDRLGRNIRQLDDTAKKLDSKGVVLVIGGVAHDPRDPMSRLLFNLLSMFAEFEADLIAARTKDRLDSIRAAGGRVGRKRATSLKQEELILDLFAQGYSYAQIRAITGLGGSALSRIKKDAEAMAEEAADPSITRARRAKEAKQTKDREKKLMAAAEKYAALKAAKAEKDNDENE
jgi:DNA invertase Pin-like site-specific DNA recombinase